MTSPKWMPSTIKNLSLHDARSVDVESLDIFKSLLTTDSLAIGLCIVNHVVQSPHQLFAAFKLHSLVFCDIV